MGQSLSADEIETLLEVYAETESLTDTAEETDHSITTVKKYRDEAIRDKDTRMPEVPSDADEGEGAEIGEIDPGQTPFGPERENRIIEDYSGMTPGDFITAFFDDFEVGVKNSWTAIQARRADRRSKLPTKDSLKQDLLSMKSGISSSALKEAEYIAIEFWAEAEQFLRATSYEAETEPISGQQAGGQMGGVGQPSHQSGFGQEFVGPGGAVSGGINQGNQSQIMQMLLQQQQQLQSELRQLKQPRGSGGGGASTLDRLEELQREKEILEEISGGDERLEQIEQQLVSLQQQAMQGNADSSPMPPAQDQSLEDRLIDQAARDPEVSLREVMDIIDSRDAQTEPPEVIEKQKELEIEKMRLESEQERNEKLADTAETLAEKFGEAIGRSIVGSDSADETTTQTQDNQQASADGGDALSMMTDANGEVEKQPIDLPANANAQQQQPTEECPHCEAMMESHHGGMTCPECQYGIGQCDLCGFPVEIPPEGEANFGLCGGCETIHEKPDDPDEEVTCDSCGWEGTGAELRGEALECDECENLRPLQRQPDPEAAQQKVEDLLED